MRAEHQVAIAVAVLVSLVASPPAATTAQTLRTLHAFSGADGSTPLSRLTPVGTTLFGTTSGDEDASGGTLFAIDTDGSNFRVLHKFSLDETGAPVASVTAVGSRLLGTTSQGDDTKVPPGTIYSIEQDGTDFRILHRFDANASGGMISRLTRGGSTLYGTTEGGGPHHWGTVFAIDIDGSNFRVLHVFSGQDGAMPLRVELVGSTLYGAAHEEGRHRKGVVYALETDGTNFRELHSIAEPERGYPIEVTVIGTTLLGVTIEGSVFAVELDGSNFRELRRLGEELDMLPYSGVTQLGGLLYGTTAWGGEHSDGAIYQIAPDGSNYGVLHSFEKSVEAFAPFAGLVAVGDTLYGVASSIEFATRINEKVDRGAQPHGAIFAFTPEAR